MVIVAFTASAELKLLLEELSLKPSPARQWIGSESWVTNRDMLKFSICAGAIGFGIQKSVIPGLREFLLDLSPTGVAASPELTEFWEDAFNCGLEKSEIFVQSWHSKSDPCGCVSFIFCFSARDQTHDFCWAILMLLIEHSGHFFLL